jgi:hypothetical protein
MPKTSWDIAPVTRTEAFDGRQDKLSHYFISMEKQTADFDLTPMFEGLPGDACICEHWGYVLAGTITYKTPQGDETFSTGDAFYVAPGHTHVLTKGGEMVEFSNSSEHDKVGAVVIKNMKAVGHDVTSGWTPDD